MGVYNSPWQGDLHNHDAAEADFVSFGRQHKAAYDADPNKPRDDEAKVVPYEGPDKAIYIQGAVQARLDQERDVVIEMRQREWDAANAFIYRALVASTRPTDLAVTRPYIGQGRAAWVALRATHAGSDNTRAGLTSAFIAPGDLKTGWAANYNEVADAVQ